MAPCGNWQPLAQVAEFRHAGPAGPLWRVRWQACPEPCSQQSQFFAFTAHASSAGVNGVTAEKINSNSAVRKRPNAAVNRLTNFMNKNDADTTHNEQQSFRVEARDYSFSRRGREDRVAAGRN